MGKFFVVGPGYVGGEVAKVLAAAGHTVITLPRGATNLPAEIDSFRGDVTLHSELRGIPENLDGVIYAVSAGESSQSAYEAAYVRGVQNVIEALRASSDAKLRFLFVSSTGVYEQQDGSVVDESLRLSPSGFAARSLFRGEELVLESGFSGCVLRLGGIYGPGRDRLVRLVREGHPFPKSSLISYSNRIHRTDCVHSILHLLHLESVAPIYNGVDSEPAPMGEVPDWISQRIGVALKFADEGGSPELHRGNKRVSNRLLLDTGYAFCYPTFREGLSSLIDGVES